MRRDYAEIRSVSRAWSSRSLCLVCPTIIALSLWLFDGIIPAAAGASPAVPRIVVIMADDLGYGDLSCYGAREIQTPNIDKLASEGIRFTNGYCTASTCTPTRFSFLTGTYAFRKPGTGVAPPNSPALITPGTPTIASVLATAGYRTAVIGKWHLGLGHQTGPDWNGTLRPGPLDIGFHDCLLLPTTNDRVPQVLVKGDRVLNLDPRNPLWVGDKLPSADHPTGLTHRHDLKMDWSHGHNGTIHNRVSRIGFYTGGDEARFRDEDLSDRWIEESRQWIRTHKDQPFFLFFAAHDLHVPRIVHQRFQGTTTQGPRGDAIVELDWCVGELLKVLRENDLEEQTIVVFCSDNGPVLDDGYVDQAIEKLGAHAPAGPFRGGKYNVFEGGTRTPFIIRWKGRVAPAVSDEVVSTIDLATSLSLLGGGELPADGFHDSFDLRSALLGDPAGRGRPHLIQQDNGQRGNFGFRVGKWKFIRYRSQSAQNVMLRLVATPMPAEQLYDLYADPGETRNLIDQYPEIARSMGQQLQEIIDAGRSRPQ